MTIVISKKRRLIDFLEEHPFEVGLSLALLMFGAESLLSGRASHSPAGLLPFAYGILSVLGGATVILGKLARLKYLWAYGLERFGFYVSASAWASYIAGIEVNHRGHGSFLMICVLGVLSIASLIRAGALNRHAKAIVFALQSIQETKEE